MRNVYYGDTVGAVSVGGIDLFHASFDALLFNTEKVSYPHPNRFPGTERECVEHCLRELEAKLEQQGAHLAGLIVEPLVQGAGGIITMPPGFLKEVEQLCRRHEVLLLADEVATGFGRTGEMFACDHEGVKPDLMAVAKGTTGGYLPVAATLATDEIYDAFYGDLGSCDHLPSAIVCHGGGAGPRSWSRRSGRRPKGDFPRIIGYGDGYRSGENRGHGGVGGSAGGDHPLCI